MTSAEPRTAAVGIAYLGCGYVADLYQNTLANWDGVLDLRGAHDRDAARLGVFTRHHGVHAYPTAEALLSDPSVEIVVNLTNPDQHHATTRMALEAGRHVYSEKPLAMRLEDAEALTTLARARGLSLACAPSTALGEAAQTLLAAVRRGERGRPRLVYAEMDDGPVHRLGHANWRTRSGAVWPAEDEFRTGCTLEHAGYALSWMVAMLGPVRRVVSLAALTMPDKGPATPEPFETPDFTVAGLVFDGGVAGRLTNSIVADHDHRFRVFCEDGVLSVDETWDTRAAVRSVPMASTRLRRQARKVLGWDGGHALRPARRRRVASARRGYPMDFALGVAEMAQALRAGRAPRLGGAFALHITEVSLAIQHPERFGADYVPRSAPESMTPMEWAAD